MTDNTPVTRGELLKIAEKFDHYPWRMDYKGVAAIIRSVLDTAEQPTPPESNPMPHAYGHCPICHTPGMTRERRPNGDDCCYNKHTYRSADAVSCKEEGCLDIPAPPATETRAHLVDGWSPEIGKREAELFEKNLPRAIAQFDRVATFSRDHDFKCTHGRMVTDECPDCNTILTTINGPSPSTDSGIVERLRDTAGRSHEIGDVLSVSLCTESASRIETLEKTRDGLNDLVKDLEGHVGTWTGRSFAEQSRAEKAVAERDQYRTAYHSEMKKSEAVGAEAKRLREHNERLQQNMKRADEWLEGVEEKHDEVRRARAFLKLALQEPSHG